MTHLPMQPDLLERYLGLLGVQRRKPGIDALCEIVRAHLERIPFENISKLYHKKHNNLRSLPSLELFLDGVERFNFGGTCYTNNYYLHQLLASLGYQTLLCGADMTHPDVHIVNIVSLEKREYLVDVGYGAPFWEPMPRDLTAEYILELGRERYVLKPRDAQGRSRMELYRDGIRKHGYTVKPAPRQIGDFAQVIADSYKEEATFMNVLMLTRFYPNRSVVIDNLKVIESEGTGSRARTLGSQEELVRAVHETFGMPTEHIRDAVKDLSRLKDAWN